MYGVGWLAPFSFALSAVLPFPHPSQRYQVRLKEGQTGKTMKNKKDFRPAGLDLDVYVHVRPQRSPAARVPMGEKNVYAMLSDFWESSDSLRILLLHEDRARSPETPHVDFSWPPYYILCYGALCYTTVAHSNGASTSAYYLSLLFKTPVASSSAIAYHHGRKSRKEGEEKTGLADRSEIRALNRLYFDVVPPRERAMYARNKCMEGPSSALSALLDSGGQGSSSVCPNQPSLRSESSSSFLFLPFLLDATAKLPGPPLSGKCTRMGNLGIRTLTVFPHGKHKTS
ncbi:hypothetical protein MGYG_09031 [Nannizzia gypsea CBS 118893]|uniref:Uncharacterized protein n=1 Tax=Arthroderma gypseum (strain ATCC MYA-4604 / CBS 118893) TaxID=535722 RepID=E4UU83_ARTGP|nr:hypothetical protein MGYG_09031 [Nannizzia gypsea CBS 118893]EFR00850.1 hypothetical protein MGYG_09031 [Nannizzia gypsea CBS 118893]